jgi:hypothetical protein
MEEIKIQEGSKLITQIQVTLMRVSPQKKKYSLMEISRTLKLSNFIKITKITSSRKKMRRMFQ